MLERARDLGFPASALPGGSVGPGEAAWSAFAGDANRTQLAEAIGVLVKLKHRAGSDA